MICCRFAGALVLLFVIAACGESEGERASRRSQEQSEARYEGGSTAECASASRRADSGFIDSYRTPKGVRFSVVTPRNYQATYAHPLLIVFAPAASDRFDAERLSAFTAPATRAGFVLAYANHPSLGPEPTRDLDHIRDRVAQTWCIDLRRVFYSGHSDGGTVSHALAVMPQTRGHSAGIAPSGAGMTEEDLAAYGCPGPQAVMVMHGARDQLFPGWGKRTARWWAGCNRCEVERTRILASGCVAYEGCDALGPTMYCEHDAGHTTWPARAASIVAFFQTVPTRTTP